MKVSQIVAGMFVGGVFTAIAVMLLARGRWAPAIPMVILSLYHLPILWLIINPELKTQTPTWVSVVVTAACWVAYFAIFFIGVRNQKSIYTSERWKDRILSIYDEKLDEWPVAISETDIKTSFGSVRVVEAGNPDGPAMVLLHASAMSSWSWIRNVQAFAPRYRLLAVDLIGEAGRSELESMGRPVMSDEDIAQNFTELFDSLGVSRAVLIGASAGGHQALRIALTLPQRVERVILSGPMGLTSPTRQLVIMGASVLFPVFPVDRLTAGWALGRSKTIREEAYPWFLLVLSGSFGRPTPPRQLEPEELALIDVPVLLILGENDNLVGDPTVASENAKAIPKVETHVLDSSHLVNLQRADEVNRLVLEFLQ